MFNRNIKLFSREMETTISSYWWSYDYVSGQFYNVHKVLTVALS